MGAESAGAARCRRLRTGLGTFLAVEAAAPSTEQAEAAVEAAFAAMAAVERRMHPSREGSDLARINALAARLPAAARSPEGSRPRPSPPIPVHSSTWELLKFAKRVNELSNGVFDPCLPCRPGTLSDVELLPDFEVRCRAPLKLDFGGFAKGYAIDQAVEAMSALGCSAGLVNAGGDLRVFGPWPETILLRDASGELSSLLVSNASAAVSRIGGEGRPAEHSGYYLRAAPSAPVRFDAAIVVASRATIADALTKCALLCTDRQLEQLERHFDTEAGLTRPICIYRAQIR